jgi:cell division protease FtsH
MQPPNQQNNEPGGPRQGPGLTPPNQQGQQPRPSFWRRNLIWIILLLVIPWGVFLFWQANSSNSSAVPVSYSQMLHEAKDGNVKSVTLTDNSVVGTFNNPVHSDEVNQTATKFSTNIPTTGESTVTLLYQDGVKITVVNNDNNNLLLTLVLQWGPFIILAIIIYFFIRRSSQAQNGIFSFGQSRARMYMGGKTKTTFADVAGVDEAKVDLEEVVDFLKNPDRYMRLGGKLPKGVLLVGPPGTGKTLLAKAVAGEADVPFFSMSGSEFVEMLVGVGASRVRDLFERAKKAAPCIVFIDELDAVGRQRGAGLGGGNDEREQTLNQILVEMDGFDGRQAVIVVAATNRPDVLDPALMRPGRFDRQVVVDRPDRPGREAILMVHTRGMPLAQDVDLRILARSTPGMVGADLANICNEAALLAARRNRSLIGMQEFEDAIDRVMMGAQRPLLLSPEERNIIAYHEGGHALVALLTPGADSVRKVTIVPRGQALGVTQFMPLDDRHNYGRNYLLTRIAVGLGGRVAEQVAIGEITTGAENDLQQVTNLAREMVTRWGMSGKIGTVFFGHERDVFLGREMSLGQQRDYSEATASAIDAEVRLIIAERYSYVEMVLARYRPLLDEIAKRLLEKEVVEESELKEIVGTISTAEIMQLAASVGGTGVPSGYGVLPSPGSVDGNSNGASKESKEAANSVAFASNDTIPGETN